MPESYEGKMVYLTTDDCWNVCHCLNTEAKALELLAKMTKLTDKLTRQEYELMAKGLRRLSNRIARSSKPSRSVNKPLT